MAISISGMGGHLTLCGMDEVVLADDRAPSVNGVDQLF